MGYCNRVKRGRKTIIFGPLEVVSSVISPQSTYLADGFTPELVSLFFVSLSLPRLIGLATKQQKEQMVKKKRENRKELIVISGDWDRDLHSGKNNFYGTSPCEWQDSEKCRQVISKKIRDESRCVHQGESTSYRENFRGSRGLFPALLVFFCTRTVLAKHKL